MRTAAEMTRLARQILDDPSPDCRWMVEFHAIASPPGRLRLTPAGDSYPHGLVPRSFQAAFWRAVSEAAQEMVDRLERR